jgi:hypothetical protein
MSTTQFRTWVIASALCAVGALTIDYLLLLLSDPDLLRQVLRDLPTRPDVVWGRPMAYLIAAIVTTLLWIAATMGLLAFKPWARSCAVAAAVMELGLMARSNGVELSNWAMVINNLSWLTWGGVLVAAYAVPSVSGRFGRR